MYRFEAQPYSVKVKKVLVFEIPSRSREIKVKLVCITKLNDEINN